MPRLTQEQRTQLAAPATGLLVFQTDAETGFYYYTGAAWARLAVAPSTSTAASHALLLYTTDGF